MHIFLILCFYTLHPQWLHPQLPPRVISDLSESSNLEILLTGFNSAVFISSEEVLNGAGEDVNGFGGVFEGTGAKLNGAELGDKLHPQ